MGSARPRFSGSSSPRHTCRSEPQILASVMRTTAAPGSGSGTGYSRISNGLPAPTNTAARPWLTSPSVLPASQFLLDIRSQRRTQVRTLERQVERRLQELELVAGVVAPPFELER